MSLVPLPTRVFLACGVTDMRKGFDGLAVLVQQVPLGGAARWTKKSERMRVDIRAVV